MTAGAAISGMMTSRSSNAMRVTASLIGSRQVDVLREVRESLVMFDEGDHFFGRRRSRSDGMKCADCLRGISLAWHGSCFLLSEREAADLQAKLKVHLFPKSGRKHKAIHQ